MDVSDIFYFFFCLGGGKGAVRGARRRRDDFLSKIPRGGGVSQAGGRGGGEGPGGLAGNLEGGAKYFFSGPKRPPSKLPIKKRQLTDICQVIDR